MASMKGGHFFTVICSSCSRLLNATCGIALNQSGSPKSAGVGRGRSPANSGGQRNLIVWVARSMGGPMLWSPLVMQLVDCSEQPADHNHGARLSGTRARAVLVMPVAPPERRQ